MKIEIDDSTMTATAREVIKGKTFTATVEFDDNWKEISFKQIYDELLDKLSDSYLDAVSPLM